MSGVPFTDLTEPAREIWSAIEGDYLDCLLSGNYVSGPAVAAFERAWAAYCGAGHAVGVGNGTDALELTLTALEVGSGDEVVVPSSTFIATAAAVVRVGATPRFADVSDATLLLTPETLSKAITPRTRAVIAVDLYGQVPDMPGLLAVADRHGIEVIEDAAQAHGAQWAGQRAGSFGAAACFSFYPTKNLGAFGDAGAVVTSDPALAERIRELSNHGRSHGSSHYEHEVVGSNSRLDALQAIVLLAKMARLDEWNERRIALAARYRDRLCATGLRLIDVATQARHVYHLFVVRAADRDRLGDELARRGIRTGMHYPLPCHLQPALRRFANGRLPVSERAAGELISLPMFPHMTEGQVDAVCDAICDVLGTRPAGRAGRARMPVPAGARPGARHRRRPPATGRLQDVAIRLLDITVALAALTVAAVPILALLLLVRLTSAGPGLFRQERLGRGQRPFIMLKLRTMRVGSDDAIHREYVRGLLAGTPSAAGATGLFKLEADPRITRLGSWLRQTSLDELPQLVNVLRGEMSLVGPRPVLPWEAEMFAAEDLRRFEVKPGMTGLWQVSGRNRLTMREQLRLDSEYVGRRSLALDLMILARTVPGLFRGGAR
jgi:dTDP-4-amino-4,6-dideoxygalactose transaminase/lipopolysaccharide/colanic/teichoic acid biosynthesis glycosyltransferase